MRKKSNQNTKDYHHGNLRDALLKETLKLLKKKNPTELSLRDLARRIGVSHGAPYRHFPSLNALLAALAEEGFHIFADFLSLNRSEQQQSEPLPRFRQMAFEFVRFSLQFPIHFRLMFTQVVVDHEEFEDLKQAGETAFRILADSVGNLQAQGILRVHDPIVTSVFIWSSLHGFCSLLLDQRLGFLDIDENKVDTIIEAFYQNMMDGLAVVK
ncbi:MAG: TetR/AcrR family transcriptional regulator [Pseudobacteriovorax sp.]|nr:TetR/AcrR family transcriptional regulator [Pseudobacteriovorax sp.]